MDGAVVTTHTTPRFRSGRNWTVPAPEEIGRLLPGCEVLSVLGVGGMGAVYLAMQTALDRSVAIKVLPVESSADESFCQRFTHEARTMARLSHPHIVPVFESGRTSGGHLYFVMEFVDGENLHTLIHGTPDNRGLPLAQALEIASQVCDALSCAQAQGVVHRDIKPSNILIDRAGTAKVADFGIARITDPAAAPFQSTQTGTVVGTPDYIAPEQMRGERVDHRADLYSVGVLLYEMLCGEVPRGVFARPSRRIACAPRIDWIVNRALQQDPALRYQNAAEMKADLDSAAALIAHSPPARSRQFFAAVAVGGALAAAAFLLPSKQAGPVGTGQPRETSSSRFTPALRDEAANRSLAEWMLRIGDSRTYLTARMADTGALVHIDSVQKIPAGRWDIIEIWLDRGIAPAGPSPVTERDFLRHTAGLTHLEHFFIRDIPLSDSAYAFLGHNPNLASVVMERTGATDAVLSNLEGLKNLKLLTIDTSVPFTGRGLEKLACLPVLEEALFYWTGCGDSVAEILGKCPNLRQAHLERTMLSDKGLAALSRASTLKRVLLGETFVTETGVAAFRKVLPECEIVR